MGTDRTSHRQHQAGDAEEQVLVADRGQVVCPRRGAIDLELCFDCSHFRGFQEGMTEGLVCGYESVLGIPDFKWGMDTTAGSLDPVR